MHSEIVVSDDKGEPIAVCSIGEFLEANREDLETCEAVRALVVGGSVNLGGGACPVVVVERFR